MTLRALYALLKVRSPYRAWVRWLLRYHRTRLRPRKRRGRWWVQPARAKAFIAWIEEHRAFTESMKRLWFPSLYRSLTKRTTLLDLFKGKEVKEDVGGRYIEIGRG